MKGETEMFNRIMDSLKRAFRNEKGQGMVEYILLVVVIALVAVAGFTIIGQRANEKATSAAQEINTPCLYMVR